MDNDKIKDDIARLEADEAELQASGGGATPIAGSTDGPNASNEVARTAPAATTGQANDASVEGETAASPDLAGRIDALFDRDIRGTRMGNDTELWNLAFSFKESVKALIAA